MSSSEYIEQSKQYCEDTLVTASHFLLSRQENDLCMILAISDLKVWENWEFDWDHSGDKVILDPRTSFHDDDWSSECKAILQVEASLLSSIDKQSNIMLRDAIEASLDPVKSIPAYLKEFHVLVKRVKAHEAWREEIHELLESGKALNQGKFIHESKVINFDGMRLASMEEMLLAKGLEEAKRKSGGKLKLVYFPNCLARILVDAGLDKAVKAYPDFLICANGKWAILEVDGRQHNLPDQAEVDNSKRRRFAMAGIPMWSFSAESVREDAGAGAERVVYQFLELLKSNSLSR